MLCLFDAESTQILNFAVSHSVNTPNKADIPLLRSHLGKQPIDKYSSLVYESFLAWKNLADFDLE